MTTQLTRKQLIDSIINIPKHYIIRFTGLGYESVMGSITKQQHDYWKRKGSRKLGEYLAELSDMNQLDYIPYESQLNSPDWYDYDSIAHAAGAELNPKNYLTIEEIDGLHNHTVLTEKLSIKKLAKHGITVFCTGIFNRNMSSLKDKHYFHGQSHELGTWTNEEKIVTNALGLQLDKLKILYADIEGKQIIHGIRYIKQPYHMETNKVTGKELKLGVKRGWYDILANLGS